jgi:hypothetical protein
MPIWVLIAIGIAAFVLFTLATLALVGANRRARSQLDEAMVRNDLIDERRYVDSPPRLHTKTWSHKHRKRYGRGHGRQRR